MVEYVNLGLGGGSEDYKTAIGNLITNGGEEVPSIVAADNDLAKHFLQQPTFVPVSEIGITADMYQNAYQYTVDFATIDGELKGLTWQATPGGFVYRTDIAEEVLGTKEVDEVQEYIKDWDTFFETAETLKEAGYSIVSGPDDIKYAVWDTKQSPWVEADTLVIDQAIIDYLEMGKKLYDGGYTAKTNMWNDDWTANFDGDVFGYFGCTWFVYWCIKSEDHAGEWHMAKGPTDYHWGGTYLAVTDACPNKELAALVAYTLTCDTDIMYKLSEETHDFVNNQAAVEKLIADGKGASEILGGQNPLETWNEAAQKIDLGFATEYDATFNGFVDNAAGSYNSGEFATVDEAVLAIKKQVQELYSYITVE